MKKLHRLESDRIAAFMESEKLPASFYETIQRIYTPLTDCVIERFHELKRSCVVGLCGPQGSGKSTGAAIMRLLLQADGLRVALLSLDDLYLTRAEHFQYFAVPMNHRALKSFRYQVTELWRKTLRRRSQRDGTTWEKINRLQQRWLPKVRILHEWPNTRFYVTHPEAEPSAQIVPARIYAGAAQQCTVLP